MLATLEKGVKGGKWFSLIDEVYSKRTLQAAFAKVKANKGAPGIDHVTIEKFEVDLEKNLEWLHTKLKDGSYLPQVIRRKYIPKPGKRREKRPLGIPTVRDRVVQTALRSVLEPIIENEFSAMSFGFRPGRGCKDALRCVQEYLNQGYTAVVDADFENYFDTISHKRLMEQIRQQISDSRILHLTTKTGIVDAVENGFDFLGYRFFKHKRFVSAKSIRKLKDTLRGKTKRTRGNSIGVIVNDVNKTLKGWFEYFKDSHQYTFYPIDSWLRVRLRSILRRQNKKKHGAWGGINNHRWPNSYFADLAGSFS